MRFTDNENMDKQELHLEKDKIKAIAESLLFVNERPIELSEISEIFGVEKKEVESALDELIGEYNQRSSGICIVKVAGGYQMCASPHNEPWIKEMYRERGKQKLSIAALETLAIIAYKQPITRMEIESIRGVNIDGVMRHLVDLGLIKIEGRKEVPGKPFMYITTRKFLEYFGLNVLKDLPKLEDFITLAEKQQAVISAANPSGLPIPDTVNAANNDIAAQTADHMEGPKE